MTKDNRTSKIIFAFLKFAFVLTVFLSSFGVHQISAQTEWYCDKRVELFPKLRAGKLKQIVSYKENPKNKLIARFVKDETEYQTAEVLKFAATDIFTGLKAKNVGEAVIETWVEIENQDFQFEDNDEDLIF